MTIDLSDLERIRDTALQEFEQRVNAADPGISVDLEVARLESQLLQLYRLAAMAARREETLEQTSALWAVVVGICDAFALKVSARCAQQPLCSAAHDRILDLRNKCRRLQDLHG